jgi:hypothetical protein
MGGMVQGLAENHDVDAGRQNGGLFQVTQPELEVPQSRLPRFRGTEGDDFLRVVDGNHLATPHGQQFAEQPLTGSEIRHIHCRQQSKQHLAKGLPRSTGTVAAVKTPATW